MKVLVITSASGKIYHHRANICIRSLLPEDSVVFYHENSIDTVSIDLSTLPPNIKTVDLWQSTPKWIYEEVVKGWPKFPDGIHNRSYWNQNGKFWFRKVLSIWHAMINNYADVYLWLDIDCAPRIPLQEMGLLWTWASEHPCAVLKRGKRRAHEIGIITFNGKSIKSITEWLKAYVSREVFTFKRWDDGYVLTELEKQGRISIANLAESPMPVSEFFRHLKGPLRYVRK